NIMPTFLKAPFQNAFKKVDNMYMERNTTNYDELILEPTMYAKLERYYEADQVWVKSIIKH
ncbi:MAG TPA: hypothetical protein PLO59_11400, partial [Bacteroidia bacterium]|nr:hypothetical protein [Bacteroidia bacterium]